MYIRYADTSTDRQTQPGIGLSLLRLRHFRQTDRQTDRHRDRQTHTTTHQAVLVQPPRVLISGKAHYVLGDVHGVLRRGGRTDHKSATHSVLACSLLAM
jgi:hypothetical protein